MRGRERSRTCRAAVHTVVIEGVKAPQLLVLVQPLACVCVVVSGESVASRVYDSLAATAATQEESFFLKRLKKHNASQPLCELEVQIVLPTFRSIKKR